MGIRLLAALAALNLLAASTVAGAQAPADKVPGDKGPVDKEMTFLPVDASSLCAECSVVQASGIIGDGTVAAFYDLVWRVRFKKNVYFVLDSLGGSMAQALRLSQIMRSLQANTVVGRAALRNGEIEIEPGTCASACVMVFIGGKTRSLPSLSRVGIHSWMPTDLAKPADDPKKPPRPWDRQTVTQLHRNTAEYMAHIDAMGVDLHMVVHALRTPYESISWLKRRELSLWSIVTVDSSLSTLASRRHPVLFLPRSETPPPVSASSSPPAREPATSPQVGQGPRR